MNIPANLKYEKTDEWIKVEGNAATVGVSDYAQEQLSDVVFVEINVTVGSTVQKGKVIATIESVKAAADVNAPASGKVTAVNEELSKTPELVNSDPYGKAWIIKMELSNPKELDALMDSAAYEKNTQERSH
jgi:glycine cleavage system H protein